MIYESVQFILIEKKPFSFISVWFMIVIFQD